MTGGRADEINTHQHKITVTNSDAISRSVSQKRHNYASKTAFKCTHPTSLSGMDFI